jgi:hypothetical protein
MNAKSVWRAAFLLTLAATTASGVGCSDSGDSSAVPGPEGGPDSTLDSGVGLGDDTSTPGDDTSVPGVDTGTGPDTGMENDTGADSEVVDSGADSPTGEDAADSTVADTGTGMDSTVADTGHEMDSALDTGTEMDSGADTGSGMDSMADTGQDSEADSAADTGTDTGADASDGSTPLAPCTTAGQTNCVQCNGWTTGLCTPTEAILVQHDIDKGFATTAGPDPAGSCYNCLLMSACIDDSTFGDSQLECEDSKITVGTAAECRATLACAIASGCAASAVAPCYCGTASVATACQGNPAPGPINGACATQIATGLGFPVTDGTDNTKDLETNTRASGMAGVILQCVLSNNCTACSM